MPAAVLNLNIDNIVWGRAPPTPFPRMPLFLYGDLLDPNVLASVLQLDEARVLRLETVVGFG
jgi:hypothetical protein